MTLLNNLSYAIAVEGDNYYTIKRRYNLKCTGAQLAQANSFRPLYPGTIVLISEDVVPGVTPPPPVVVPPVVVPPVTTPPTTYPGRYTRGFGYYPNFAVKPNTYNRVQTFTTALNRLPDLFMVSAWGKDAHSMNSAIWGQFIDPVNSYLPSIASQVNVEVLLPMNLDGGSPSRANTFAGRDQIKASMLDVANKKYDTDHLYAARNIAKVFPKAIIRLGSEADSFDWGNDNFMHGNHVEYIAAYRHLVNLYRSVSPTFEFSWCTLHIGWGSGTPAAVGYPGSAWVDYITMDIYHRNGNPATATDMALNLTRLKNHANFAETHKRKVGYPEWCSANTNDATWFNFMTNYFESLGDQFGYAVYFASAAKEEGYDYNPQNFPKVWEAFVNYYKKR